jgi:hypothetical protein
MKDKSKLSALNELRDTISQISSGNLTPSGGGGGHVPRSACAVTSSESYNMRRARVAIRTYELRIMTVRVNKRYKSKIKHFNKGLTIYRDTYEYKILLNKID